MNYPKGSVSAVPLLAILQMGQVSRKPPGNIPMTNLMDTSGLRLFPRLDKYALLHPQYSSSHCLKSLGVFLASPCSDKYTSAMATAQTSVADKLLIQEMVS